MAAKHAGFYLDFQTGRRQSLTRVLIGGLRLAILASRWQSFDMKIAAVLGASTNPAKYGNQAVRAYVRAGYRVFPVNPRATTIEGLPCYPTLEALPQRPDLISVYLPPAMVLELLPAIAARGCDELWLNPGTESDEVLAGAAKLGLPVIQACSILAVGARPEHQ